MTSEESLRSLIREKLQSGILPGDDCTKVFGGPSNGETCDAWVKSQRRWIIEVATHSVSSRPVRFRG